MLKGSLRIFWLSLAFGSTSASVASPQNDIFAVRSGGEIDRITPAGVVSVVVSGLPSPTALKFDRAGNLYVSCNSQFVGQATVRKITPAGIMSTFATGLTSPTAMLFDNSGNLYVTDETQDYVNKITPQGVVTKYANVGGEPEGLAFDHNGNLFVSTLSSTLFKVTPAGAATLFADLRQRGGAGLAIDGADNLYMTDDGPSIFKITPSGAVSLFGTGGTGLLGLTFDTGGDLLAADFHDAAIREFSPAGVMSTLVTGLNLVEDLAIPEPSGHVLLIAGASAWLGTRSGRGRRWPSGVGAAIPVPSRLSSSQTTGGGMLCAKDG
jgi:hypothetical protein